MTRATRRATTVAALALTTTLTGAPLLAAGIAQAADTAPSRSKAAIEHDERLTTGSTSTTGQLTKAQIEHGETAARSTSSGSTDDGAGRAAATGGDAAAWQLATAAALGALVTGAAFAGARQVAQHRPTGHVVAR